MALSRRLDLINLLPYEIGADHHVIVNLAADSKMLAVPLISLGPGDRAAAVPANAGDEESPGSTEQRCRVTPGGFRSGGNQGQCHRKHTACLRAGKVERVRQERTASLATAAAR